MLAEKVATDLAQVAPAEAGAGQPHHDRLAHHDVDGVTTVAPAEADDVRPGVTPRYGGFGPASPAQRPERAAQQTGGEDHGGEQGPGDSHRKPLRVPRRPGGATRP